MNYYFYFALIKMELERSNIIKNNMTKLFPKYNYIPNIAIVGSGGSYRSMITSLAGTMALEHLKLLGLCKYFSSLSGSTWFLSSWINNNKSLYELKSFLRERLIKDMINIDNSLISEIFIQKLIYGKELSFIDIWGLLISNVIMPSSRKTALLSNMTDPKYPIPYYSAISTNNKEEYEWVSFDPEKTSIYLDQKINIPTKYLNSIYNKGRIIKQKHEPLLYKLIGICSSAFSIELKDVKRIYGYDNGLLSIVEGIMKYMNVSDRRLIESGINNFVYNLDVKDPFDHDEYLKLIDAGIYINIPIIPLLDKNIDIYIVFDATDGDHADNLRLTLKYIQEHNIDYKMPYDMDIQIDSPLTILRAQNAPTIIYISSKSNFSTFKFKYTPEEFDNVFYQTYNMIINNSNIIYEVFDRLSR